MRVISDNPTQTQLAGVALGRLLQPGDLICLSGALGAGKTCLAAAIGRGWGAQPALTSPTFTLVHEHGRDSDDGVLFHIDCYRLRDAFDAMQAGLEDALSGQGPALIEWPERVGEALPEERLWVSLEILGPARRHLRLKANGERHKGLITAFQGLAL